MNQPTTNTSSSSTISAPGEAPEAIASSNEMSAPPESPLPKTARQNKRKTKALALVAQAKAVPQGRVAPQDRCRHFTVTGRRCRLAILDPASGLCFRHVSRQFLAGEDEDLSPAFLGLLSGFRSATRIHDFVTQVTVLLVQNRISTRRAAILAYLAQILLRTLPAIEQQENGAEDSGPMDAAELFPPHMRDRIYATRRRIQEAQEKRRALNQPQQGNEGGA